MSTKKFLIIVLSALIMVLTRRKEGAIIINENLNRTTMDKRTDEKDKYKDIIKIYKGLSETKKLIWIGNGNLLLASQKAELKKCKKTGGEEKNDNT